MDINLDYPWGLTNEVFDKIIEYSINHKIENILEYGSGYSTIKLSKSFPDANVLSIEHSEDYVDKTRSLIKEYNLDSKCSVDHLNLKWQRCGSYVYKSYSPQKFTLNFDLVIIDGPPYSTRRGREAALYQVLNHLNKNAIIVLDDAHRRAEKQIIQNWKKGLGDYFTFETVQCEKKEVCFLTNEIADPKLHFSTSVQWDNILRTSRYFFDKIFYPSRF